MKSNLLRLITITSLILHNNSILVRSGSCLVIYVDCGHTISIILDLNEDSQHYVKSFFTIAAHKKTYEQPIFPLDFTNVNGGAIHSLPMIVSDDEVSESDDNEGNSILPLTRRPPEGPKSLEFVVNMTKLIAQNVSSSVQV